MEIIENFDLLSVAVAVAATFILGFTVFFSDRNNITNKSFLLLSLITGLWGLVNFFGYTVVNHIIALQLLRLVMFLAVLQAFAVFQLFLVFPKKDFIFSKLYTYLVLPIVLITAFIALSPLVFSRIGEVASNGAIINIINGPAIPLFGIVSVGLVVSAFFIFIRHLKKAEQNQKKPYVLMLLGVTIMFVCIIVFNFIFPALLNNANYLPFGALFTFPFVAFTSYAILKHKIFNIKVASVGIIAFILTIFSFFNILYATDTSQIILNVTFFFGILLGSISLIKTILIEIEQKEYLQALNKELNDLIQQRESLVHLITHKVKGAFTRSKYIFAEILEGSFGAVSPALKDMAEKGLDSDNAGITTVDLILNAYNLQKGTVKYDMKKIDFKNIVTEIVTDKKNVASTKNLALEVDIKEDDYSIMGDTFWLKEVVVNLIQNAILYTQEGKVMVNLSKNDDKILFSVKDTGIGITDEDKKNLFTEGGRGKDSVKTNVDSTGYGLFSVKLIVEAHKGRIWAESEGVGKGSTFTVEMPVGL